MASATGPLSAAPAREERMVGGVPSSRVYDPDRFRYDHLTLRTGRNEERVAPGPQGNVCGSIPIPMVDAKELGSPVGRRIEPEPASPGRVPATDQSPRPPGDGEINRRARPIDHRPRRNE